MNSPRIKINVSILEPEDTTLKIYERLKDLPEYQYRSEWPLKIKNYKPVLIEDYSGQMQKKVEDIPPISKEFKRENDFNSDLSFFVQEVLFKSQGLYTQFMRCLPVLKVPQSEITSGSTANKRFSELSLLNKSKIANWVATVGGEGGKLTDEHRGVFVQAIKTFEQEQLKVALNRIIKEFPEINKNVSTKLLGIVKAHSNEIVLRANLSDFCNKILDEQKLSTSEKWKVITSIYDIRHNLFSESEADHLTNIVRENTFGSAAEFMSCPAQG